MGNLPTPNYTQVPNIILDEHMLDMGASELKVTLAIVRQTIGFHIEEKLMSISYLMEKTGLSRQAVISGTKKGVERGTLTKSKHGSSHTYSLNLSTKPASQKNRLVNDLDTPASQQSRHPLVNKVDTLLVNDLDTYKERSLNKPFKEREREDLVPNPQDPGKTSPSEISSKASIPSTSHIGSNGKSYTVVLADPDDEPITLDNPCKNRALEIYAEIFGIDIANNLSAFAKKFIGNIQFLNASKWRDACEGWALSGYNAGNTKGIYDWYLEGKIGHQKPSTKTGANYASNQGVSTTERPVIYKGKIAKPKPRPERTAAAA